MAGLRRRGGFQKGDTPDKKEDLTVENVWGGWDVGEALLGGDAPSGVFLGIDLGTSNSCAALWYTSKNRVKMVKDEDGRRIVPSTLTFSEGDGIEVVSTIFSFIYLSI